MSAALLDGHGVLVAWALVGLFLCWVLTSERRTTRLCRVLRALRARQSRRSTVKEKESER